jgi:hypothetical protein
MGFRLRRSIRLGKFLRLNLGAKSASVSVGVRGARVNLGSHGPRFTAGIPGTGVSYTTPLGGESKFDAPGNNLSADAGSGAFRTGCGCLLMIGALAGVGAITGVIDQGNAGVAAAVAGILLCAVVGAAMGRQRAKAREVERRLEAERQLRLQAQREEAERQSQLDEYGRRKFEEARSADQRRWNELCARYGQENAERIWDRTLWVGCSDEMLVEMLGKPIDIDERVLKTKISKTFKYEQRGKNRFALRIFVENGAVTGWDDKR